MPLPSAVIEEAGGARGEEDLLVEEDHPIEDDPPVEEDL